MYVNLQFSSNHLQVLYYLQDLDSTDKLDQGLFTITTQGGNGVIRLVGSLDYERRQSYQLRILAVDRASRGKVNTATTMLLVRVQDVEDTPPEFVFAPALSRIPEDAELGTEVLRGQASIIVLPININLLSLQYN